jgi:hypothetical protein
MAKDSRLSVPGGGGGAKSAANNKRFGVGQSRPATKAETSATTAKYKASIARTMSSNKVASNSVKVLPPLSDVARASANVTSAIKASNAKSGAAARVGAAKAVNRNWYMSPLGSKPPVIKINSNK